MRDALLDGVGRAIEVEHRAGGRGDRIVVGGLAGAGEDGAQSFGVFLAVAAGEVS